MVTSITGCPLFGKHGYLTFTQWLAWLLISLNTHSSLGGECVCSHFTDKRLRLRFITSQIHYWFLSEKAKPQTLAFTFQVRLSLHSLPSSHLQGGLSTSVRPQCSDPPAGGGPDRSPSSAPSPLPWLHMLFDFNPKLEPFTKNSAQCSEERCPEFKDNGKCLSA